MGLVEMIKVICLCFVVFLLTLPTTMVNANQKAMGAGAHSIKYTGQFSSNGSTGTVEIIIIQTPLDTYVAYFSAKTDTCLAIHFPVVKLQTNLSVNWAPFKWNKRYGSAKGLIAIASTYATTYIGWTNLRGRLHCKIPDQQYVTLNISNN